MKFGYILTRPQKCFGLWEDQGNENFQRCSFNHACFRNLIGKEVSESIVFTQGLGSVGFKSLTYSVTIVPSLIESWYMKSFKPPEYFRKVILRQIINQIH
jgi:hypothetical protein